MNWDAIGAIGEIIGALAVVATLAYLALQVRHARTEMNHSIRQHRDTSLRELLLEPARNPDLADLMVKARRHVGSTNPFQDQLTSALGLTESEAIRFSRHMEAWWFYRAATIASIAALTNAERENFDRHMRGQYSKGPESVWWACFRQIRSSDDPAVLYVDNLLAQPR